MVSLAARLRLRALALPPGLLALRPPPSSEAPSMFRSGQPAGLPSLACPQQLVPALSQEAASRQGGASTAVRAQQTHHDSPDVLALRRLHCIRDGAWL